MALEEGGLYKKHMFKFERYSDYFEEFAVL